MKKTWLQKMEKRHRLLMTWMMKRPFWRKSLWPGWEHERHHGLFFHPCIVDWVYCQFYKREPEERCSYCPLAQITDGDDIECCHGLMWEFEKALKMHDEERVVEYIRKIRDLPWENPHDVRTRWHTARLVRACYEKEDEDSDVSWHIPEHRYEPSYITI